MKCGGTQKVAGSTSLNSLICIALHLCLMTAQEIKILAAKDSDPSSFRQDDSCFPFLLSSVSAAFLSATRQAPVLGSTSRTSKADEGVGGMLQVFSSRAPRPVGPCLSKHATLKRNWGLFIFDVMHQSLLAECEGKRGERSSVWLDRGMETRWCRSHLEKAEGRRCFPDIFSSRLPPAVMTHTGKKTWKWWRSAAPHSSKDAGHFSRSLLYLASEGEPGI